MLYKHMQQQLKDLRNAGYEITCKLNAKSSVLAAELKRLETLVSTSVHGTPTHAASHTQPQDTQPTELELAHARIAELEAQVAQLQSQQTIAEPEHELTTMICNKRTEHDITQVAIYLHNHEIPSDALTHYCIEQLYHEPSVRSLINTQVLAAISERNRRASLA